MTSAWNMIYEKCRHTCGRTGIAVVDGSSGLNQCTMLKTIMMVEAQCVAYIFHLLVYPFMHLQLETDQERLPLSLS